MTNVISFPGAGPVPSLEDTYWFFENGGSLYEGERMLRHVLEIHAAPPLNTTILLDVVKHHVGELPWWLRSDPDGYLMVIRSGEHGWAAKDANADLAIVRCLLRYIREARR